VFFNIDKVFYSFTIQHQYIVNRLHVSVLSNYLQCVHILWDLILFT
jgi:hypothetical protein